MSRPVRIPIAPTTLRTIRLLRDLLLDFAYPPRCGGCDRRGTLLCLECRASIKRMERVPPVPDIDRLVCAGLFDGPLRKAIHRFKYESDAPLAKPLAGLMHEALLHARRPDATGDRPVLVPVPLHSSRRKSRGYNQA